ncbi:MAG TPA: sulfotransferase [Acidimicrobiales bacterium]|nr:sulfotransferase [Acidimicrobiales bacterium]
MEAWKRCVPRRYQQLVIESRVTWRRDTDPHRPLPDFLVIGAQRSGTSSLYKYLEQHPSVLASLRKETEYLSARWCKGEAWYRAHFPSRLRRSVEQRLRGRTPVSFEASPNYLFHPGAPVRAAQLLPDAKLVVLLRNPVDRAFSHFQHEVRAGRETLSFEEALEREPERLEGQEERMAVDPCFRSFTWERFSYVSRGRYAEQLERWLQFYPRDRLLVVPSEKLYADPAATYRRLVAFLELPEWMPAAFRNHSYGSASATPSVASQLPAGTRRWLEERFAEPNQQLYSMTGRDFGWR